MNAKVSTLPVLIQRNWRGFNPTKVGILSAFMVIGSSSAKAQQGQSGCFAGGHQVPCRAENTAQQGTLNTPKTAASTIDSGLAQQLDNINSQNMAYIQRNWETIEYDPKVSPENTKELINIIGSHYGGYEYFIPVQWFWYYNVPTQEAGLPKHRGPVTWFLPNTAHLNLTENYVGLPDWEHAIAADPATDNCTKDPSQRRLLINFPRRGDYVCAPVPTNPAIWIHNPNVKDTYLPMVAVGECPDGLTPRVPQCSTTGSCSLPATGDMDCEPDSSASPSTPNQWVCCSKTGTTTDDFGLGSFHTWDVGNCFNKAGHITCNVKCLTSESDVLPDYDQVVGRPITCKNTGTSCPDFLDPPWSYSCDQ